MKKALKILAIIVGIVLIPVIGGISYFYVAFNNYSLEDNYLLDENNLSYYNDTYDEARNDFRLKSAELAMKYPGIKNFNLHVENKKDTNLTIDFCFIPGSDDDGKILILSSGVHGVEGFVGSAVQLFLMNNYINDEFLSKTSVLLIHGVNPYGFKYGRRVTENNVDVNRNSDINKELYQTINEGYPRVYDLINQKGKVKTRSLGNRFFFLKAIRSIVKESMPVFRQAVLQGQYKFPEGLFYGGNNFEPQIKDLVPIIDTICNPYKTVFALDLHTAYGERGKLHLFPSPVKESVKKRMETIFEGSQINWGGSDDFYTITGDFVSYIGKINNDKIFIPMTFEYGTMDSQTTVGSIKSLHVMVLENQVEQYGYESDIDLEKVKNDFIEMNYPSSDEWRSHIIDETKILFEKSLKRFCELEFQ
ncbi:MAG: DUF2817 domain-containing protein [Bacteroidales bacterium]|nr:DUF2817 domain-containing protein [Bacteroidales bacterium]